MRKKPKKKRRWLREGPPKSKVLCQDCGREERHTHCSECGSTTHGAAYCDAEPMD